MLCNRCYTGYGKRLPDWGMRTERDETRGGECAWMGKGGGGGVWAGKLKRGGMPRDLGWVYGDDGMEGDDERGLDGGRMNFDGWTDGRTDRYWIDANGFINPAQQTDSRLQRERGSAVGLGDFAASCLLYVAHSITTESTTICTPYVHLATYAHAYADAYADADARHTRKKGQAAERILAKPSLPPHATKPSQASKTHLHHALMLHTYASSMRTKSRRPPSR